MTPHLRVSRQTAGFTLIELLTVVVIIAVLAAILFPTLSSIIAKGDSTACISNLRQIGIAIISYTNDNDGSLPGPLNLAQTPTFKTGATGSLPQYLAPYLNLAPQTGALSAAASNKNNVFVCPAYRRQFPNLDGAVYGMNMRKMTAYSQPPWGDNASNQTPVKKAVLAQWTETGTDGNDHSVDSTQTFAMRDIDQTDQQYGGATPSASVALPQTPVHKDHRNALYYDFHAASMQLNDQTTSWKPSYMN